MVLFEGFHFPLLYSSLAYYCIIITVVVFGTSIIASDLDPCISMLTHASLMQMDIFPYSVFYIFFEQYLDIWRVALMDIALALG